MATRPPPSFTRHAFVQFISGLAGRRTVAVLGRLRAVKLGIRLLLEYSQDSHYSQIYSLMKTPKSSKAPQQDGAWTLAGAKARLSEVVERAQAGPQVITRNGKPTAVVVSVEEWSRKTERKGTLAEFLLASPLRGADLDLPRATDKPRDIEL